ncbi:hypothetical protein C8D88_112165 [Lentzea atacamensis]|uniref:Uncharacterized protein n=1 Tax=Lentzea atacamensis TaxID=531938 RepID=A0A316HQN6_9PSEU|nr:hypothetical protein [Lentzea atacamensis]PWK82915.1 hypothetical protein C8D88_112165 [Lentzea atacamensis]
MKTPKHLPPRQKRPEPVDQGEVLRKVGAVLANVTVITGLLVAFGWKRSDTQSRALGIESNILGMSTADYMLRSITPVFVLLAVVVVSGLVWLWLEPRLRSALLASKPLRTALAWAWVQLPLVVVGLGYVWPVASFYTFPLAVGGGILLSCYVIRLRAGRDWNWPRIRLFAAAAGVLCLFWAALNYAQVDGQRMADEFAAHAAPSVTVYSQERLHISAPGVREQALDGEKSRYRYRYVGLLLLENTGGKYFLVSDEWTRSSGVVVVLRDEPATRLEFSR